MVDDKKEKGDEVMENVNSTEKNVDEKEKEAP